MRGQQKPKPKTIANEDPIDFIVWLKVSWKQQEQYEMCHISPLGEQISDQGENIQTDKISV